MASQVTNSSNPISPDVFTLIAFSLDLSIEILCKSILLERSKHIYILEFILVSSSIFGIQGSVFGVTHNDLCMSSGD